MNIQKIIKTITSNLYCNQVRRLKTTLAPQKNSSFVNRKGVTFHHDNACFHTTLLIKNLVGHDWKKLLHPLYPLYLAPSDHQLSRRLQNHFDDLKLTSRKKVEHELVLCFASKEYKESGICELIGRWNEVLGNIEVMLIVKFL